MLTHTMAGLQHEHMPDMRAPHRKDLYDLMHGIRELCNATLKKVEGSRGMELEGPGPSR
jgi:hypothetical protein